MSSLSSTQSVTSANGIPASNKCYREIKKQDSLIKTIANTILNVLAWVFCSIYKMCNSRTFVAGFLEGCVLGFIFPGAPLIKYFLTGMAIGTIEASLK